MASTSGSSRSKRRRRGGKRPRALVPIEERFAEEVVARSARLVGAAVTAVGAPEQPQHFHLVDGRRFAAALQILLRELLQKESNGDREMRSPTPRKRLKSHQ